MDIVGESDFDNEVVGDNDDVAPGRRRGRVVVNAGPRFVFLAVASSLGFWQAADKDPEFTLEAPVFSPDAFGAGASLLLGAAAGSWSFQGIDAGNAANLGTLDWVCAQALEFVAGVDTFGFVQYSADAVVALCAASVHNIGVGGVRCGNRRI